MEKATEDAGKPDEKKQKTAAARYTHKSNHKAPGSAGAPPQGGEGSPAMLGKTENKGDGQAHSPLKQLNDAHEGEWKALDAKHAHERTSMNQRHEANLTSKGEHPETHRAHHEERMRLHHAHSHERNMAHAKQTMDHMTAAGIHGAAGMGASPNLAPGGSPAAGAMNPAGMSGPQAQPPVPGAPAAV